MIFISCFDPIIQSLNLESKCGYNLDGVNIITAPFADDFCVISHHKKTHQRLINTTNSHIKSMGMKLKPSKCRSLSLSSGSAKSIPFHIDGDEIPTLDKESHKFLGSLITFKNSSADIFNYLYQMIETSLENVASSLIRNEYKLKIYIRYFLPSLRYHLTVNDMCSSHLSQLDALTNRYLKKWSGIPHPGTLAFLHMPNGLNISTITDLYTECHTLNHIAMRNRGDEIVNHCLDTRLSRESQWVRKKSFVVQSETIYREVSDDTSKGVKQQKDLAKDSLRTKVANFWHDHVKSLVVQGKFLDLLSLESNCTLWRSVMFNLPERVLKFLTNALGDSLNTKANLQRWGRSSSNKCKNCSNTETLHHCLNNCSVQLDQGRYTWRHNNILKYFVELSNSGLANDPSKPRVIHDIPNVTGFANGSTIPTKCTQTALKPDLCIYWENMKKLFILELTVPFETGIEKAHAYKTNKYAPIVSDIQNNGINVTFLAIEVGSRGFVSEENSKRLKSFLSTISKPVNFKKCRDKTSKIAIVSSFVLYHAKEEKTWDKCTLLEVN